MYNKSDIMKKAHSLRKVYGFSKSEALTKAWMMAKIQKLEESRFTLEMKDRWNKSDRALSAEMSTQIQAFKTALYPKTVNVHTIDSLGIERRRKMTASLERLKAIENPDFSTRNLIYDLEYKLESSLKIWANSTLNESAYNAA